MEQYFFFSFFLFFFFQICEVGYRWVGDRAQEDLAKFDYNSERKIEKKIKPPSYILATFCNLLSKYDDFPMFFPSFVGPFFLN